MKMRFRDIFGSKAVRLKSLLTRSSENVRSRRTISEESIGQYCKGGYHPVRIGDLLHHGKYEIVRKIGYGVYSTVWLTYDRE